MENGDNLIGVLSHVTCNLVDLFNAWSMYCGKLEYVKRVGDCEHPKINTHESWVLNYLSEWTLLAPKHHGSLIQHKLKLV